MLLMKTFTLALLSFLCAFDALAQNQKLRADAKQDALWMRQYLNRENKLEAAKDDAAARVKWLSGKIIYTPDSCLRFCQLMGRIGTRTEPVYTAAAQGMYQGKVINLAIPTDNEYYSFSDYPIATIVRLHSGKQSSYLMLSASYGWPLSVALVSRNLSAPLKKSWLNPNRFYHAATLLRLSKNELTDIGFEQTTETRRYGTDEVISGNSLHAQPVFTFKSKRLASYLKYDIGDNTITFMVNTYNYKNEAEESENTDKQPLFVTRHSGYFSYKGDSFMMEENNTSYEPKLQSLSKVIATRNFKTGKYITKVIATIRYEEVGFSVLPVLYTDYYINGKKFGSVDNTINIEPDKFTLEPEFTALDANHIVFFITDRTNDHLPGDCGACDFENSTFMLATPSGVRPLLYVSWDTRNVYTQYAYVDKNLDKEHIFYLEDEESTRDNGSEAQIAAAYWKDKSTYVFKVSDGNQYRNFYLKFINQQSKISVKVMPGQLMDEEKKQEAEN